MMNAPRRQRSLSLSAPLVVVVVVSALLALAFFGSGVEGFAPASLSTDSGRSPSASSAASSSSFSSPTTTATTTTTTTTALSMVGPLQKVTNAQEYNRVVEGLMLTQGITREQAEVEYNSYLENPNNYALNKGEAYYKSLGYKSLMDGVIGEAEKEGRGEEVRARIEAFKKKSKLKGLSVITIGTAILFYYNTVNPYTPPPHL